MILPIPYNWRADSGSGQDKGGFARNGVSNLDVLNRLPGSLSEFLKESDSRFQIKHSMNGMARPRGPYFRAESISPQLLKSL
jgi:hypothetical protein